MLRSRMNLRPSARALSANNQEDVSKPITTSLSAISCRGILFWNAALRSYITDWSSCPARNRRRARHSPNGARAKILNRHAVQTAIGQLALDPCWQAPNRAPDSAAGDIGHPCPKPAEASVQLKLSRKLKGILGSRMDQKSFHGARQFVSPASDRRLQ